MVSSISRTMIPDLVVGIRIQNLIPEKYGFAPYIVAYASSTRSGSDM